MKKSVAFTASLSLLLLAPLPLPLQAPSLLQPSPSQSEPIPLLNAPRPPVFTKATNATLTHAFDKTAPIWQTSAVALPAMDPTHPMVVVDNNSKIKKGTPVMLVAIGLVKPTGSSQATPHVLAVRSVDSLQTALAMLQPAAGP